MILVYDSSMEIKNNIAQENRSEHPFKNHQMPLPMRIFFSATTFSFKVLGVISPKLAGMLALRLFMTPPKFNTPKREQKLRDESVHSFIDIRDRQISVRSWGEGPTILLSHGWAGRSSQFHAFIEPLVAARYRVVGFEIPGHGDSTGKRTNMLDVANILAKVAAKEDRSKQS
jgi:predicted alpha/beta-fold hydrolase